MSAGGGSYNYVAKLPHGVLRSGGHQELILDD
jgi:hypothetical protein